MANNNNETRTSIDNLNDQLTGLEQKVQNNQKIIAWICIAVAAVVCIVLLYIYAIHKPGAEAARNAIGQADITLSEGNDSLALVQYKQVAADYGHEGGNRAKLNAAILLYKQGQWQEAINYLDDYKPRRPSSEQAHRLSKATATSISRNTTKLSTATKKL